MATRSFVAVNEGSDKKLATYAYADGADTKHDELVVLGEQPLPGYAGGGAVSNISTATAASHLVQIMAGANLRVRIRRIEIYQTVMATAAVLAQFVLVRLTSAGTGGTAFGPAALDPADAAPGATGIALPGVKGAEGTIIAQAWPYMMQTLTASAERTNPIVVWDFDHPRLKPLIIAAGTANGIAIKNNIAIAGASVHVDVWFDEAPY